MTDEERRTLELLAANHAFPGDYPLTVIALNDDEVTQAIVRSIEEQLAAPLGDDARMTSLSSGGKYVSHRMRVRCQEAGDVMRLYAGLRRVDGVVTVL